MASREFTDSDGVVWHVWDVTPEHLHPATKAEDFMEPWVGGWLAFESATGRKRRLQAPYPSRWMEYDLAKLEMLCRAATPVGTRRKNTPQEQLAITEKKAEVEERAEAERTFVSPRGRTWTLRLHESLRQDGTTETVLRFTSGDSVVDLNDWPENWKKLSPEELAVLLLDAEPPRRLERDDRPQRRREDRP